SATGSPGSVITKGSQRPPSKPVIRTRNGREVHMGNGSQAVATDDDRMGRTARGRGAFEPRTLGRVDRDPAPSEQIGEPAEIGQAAEGSSTEDTASATHLIRRYLKEIGRVPLLTAAQEIALGQRIERGQEKTRRAIMGVPMVRRWVMERGGHLRIGPADTDAFIEAPDGTALTESELKRVGALLARIRRLDREIEKLRVARTRLRAVGSRRTIRKWISRSHRERTRLLGDLPLKPV